MDDITPYIETMRTAVYGRDMREAICQSFTQLNTLPADISGSSSLPKKICTFMLSALLGVLKINSAAFINNTSGYRLSTKAYDPDKGDRIILWRNDSEPMKEGEDYSITKDSQDGGYTLKLLEEEGLWANLQIWNIPTGSGTAAPVSSHLVSSALPTNLSMVVDQEFISEGE